MSGFEPETYSFVCTSFFKMFIRGLDCILSIFREAELSSPCQSFGPRNYRGHGLDQTLAIDRYSGFTVKFL